MSLIDIEQGRAGYAGMMVVRTYRRPYLLRDQIPWVEVGAAGTIEDFVEQGQTRPVDVENRSYLAQMMSDSDPKKWSSVKVQSGDDCFVELIKQPTASHMSHRMLNPYLYLEIGNVGSLDRLAELLQSPADWRDRYDRLD